MNVHVASGKAEISNECWRDCEHIYILLAEGMKLSSSFSPIEEIENCRIASKNTDSDWNGLRVKRVLSHPTRHLSWHTPAKQITRAITVEFTRCRPTLQRPLAHVRSCNRKSSIWLEYRRHRWDCLTHYVRSAKTTSLKRNILLTS